MSIANNNLYGQQNWSAFLTRVSGRRWVVLAVVMLTLIGGAFAIVQPWSGCPSDWTDASRIELPSSAGDVMLDGKPFRVGGHALLDDMPRIVDTPLERLRYQMRGERHPLGITASISAPSRMTLGEPVFTCFRVTRDGAAWASRPTTHGVQQLSDGDPPGAQPRANNDAWRMASATDGPEWQAGDRIDLELWARVNGRHYIFVVPPFELMKGR